MNFKDIRLPDTVIASLEDIEAYDPRWDGVTYSVLQEIRGLNKLAGALLEKELYHKTFHSWVAPFIEFGDYILKPDSGLFALNPCLKFIVVADKKIKKIFDKSTFYNKSISRYVINLSEETDSIHFLYQKPPTSSN